MVTTAYTDPTTGSSSLLTYTTLLADGMDAVKVPAVQAGGHQAHSGTPPPPSGVTIYQTDLPRLWQPAPAWIVVRSMLWPRVPADPMPLKGQRWPVSR